MDQRAVELKAQGMAAFQDNDYRSCITLTTAAISALKEAADQSTLANRGAIAGELSRLHSNLAAAFIELHDYSSAATEARAAIDLDPSWCRPYLRLCIALASVASTADSAPAVLQSGLQACQSPEQLRVLQRALEALQHRPGGPNASSFTPAPSDLSPTAPHIQEPILPAIKKPRSTAFTNQQQSPSQPPTEHPNTLPCRVSPPPPPSPRPPTEFSPPKPTPHSPIQQRLLPVTALCGFLGAGKTTLVRHLLSRLGSQASARIGILVNDLAPFNVDAQLLTLPPPPPSAPPDPPSVPTDRSFTNTPGLPTIKAPCAGASTINTEPCPPNPNAATDASDATNLALSAEPPAALDFAAAAATAPAELVELSNGCVCCNLRGDLQAQLSRLAARQPPLEHVVVECTGVGEPEALAGAVAALEGQGVVLARMVTVVDASTFLNMVQAGGGGEAPRKPSGGAAATDGGGVKPLGGGHGCGGGRPAVRHLGHLLVQQVEGADVVLLNKCDRLLELEKRRRQKVDCHPITSVEYGQSAVQEHADLAGEAGKARANTENEEAEAAARQALRRVAAVVRSLNPGARVLSCVRCEVAIQDVLSVPVRNEAGGGQRGDGVPGLNAAPATHNAGGSGAVVLGIESSHGTSAGRLTAARSPQTDPSGDVNVDSSWADSGRIDRAHEEEEYGIGSYVFRSRRPFHPGRMWALLQGLARAGLADGAGADAGGEGRVLSQGHSVRGESVAGSEEGADGEGGEPLGLPLPCQPPVLLRAKGLFWVASLSQAIWELSLAGHEAEVAAVGRWLCTMVSPQHWPVGRRRRRGRQLNGNLSPHWDAGEGPSTETEDSGGSDQGSGDEEDDSGARSAGGGWAYEVEVRRGGEGGGVHVFRPHSARDGKGGDACGDGTSEQGVGEGHDPRQDDRDARSERSDDRPSKALDWHRRWGDRRNGLVFIRRGLRDVPAAAPVMAKPGTVSVVGARGAAEEGSLEPGTGGPEGESAVVRLSTLLRWAQLTEGEVAEGEEVWEGWDDTPWLGLLERY